MTLTIREIRTLLAEKEHVAYCTAMDEPRDPFGSWCAGDFEDDPWDDDDWAAWRAYRAALDKFREERATLYREIHKLKSELADAVKERKAFKKLRKVLA